MGKTPKPLRIHADASFIDWAELIALREQGHEIHWIDYNDEWPRPDIFIAPYAWLMDEAHRKYLPLAIAEARRRRYPKQPKEAD